MVIRFEISERGLKQAKERIDPKHLRSARNRAVGRAADFMLVIMRANSRVGTSQRYIAGWHKVGRGQEARAIINEVPYAKYVTGRTQLTIHEPQAEAGDAFLNLMRRNNTGQMRRIMNDSLNKEFQ